MLLQNLERLHEALWYHLYLRILRTEAKRKKQVYDILEALLPWLNIEMWHKLQEDKEEGRQNVAFESQLEAALRNELPPDDIVLDTLTASQTNIAELFKRADSTGNTGSIKDTLFSS